MSPSKRRSDSSNVLFEFVLLQTHNNDVVLKIKQNPTIYTTTNSQAVSTAGILPTDRPAQPAMQPMVVGQQYVQSTNLVADPAHSTDSLAKSLNCCTHNERIHGLFWYGTNKFTFLTHKNKDDGRHSSFFLGVGIFL